MTRHGALALALALLGGCGPEVGGEGGSASSSADGSEDGVVSVSTSDGGSTGTATTATSGVSSTQSTSSTSDSGVDEGPTCILHEIAPDPNECTLVGGCCPGDKCIPGVLGAGGAFDFSMCVPVAPAAHAIGETCEGIGSDDDCVVGAVCLYGVDAIGMSTAVCEEETCPHAELCFGEYGSGLGVCRPICDPLADDCVAGEICINDGSEGFACMPDWGGGVPGQYGDGCGVDDLYAPCDPGLVCAPDARVAAPSCAIDMEPGCCTPYCATDAMIACPGEAGGESCLADGFGRLPMVGNVGACLLP